ncbi:MAG: hypothetical protein M0024_04730 [Nitrospiraceae bacterium]|nr:hypothetical protein [Nitrospiraceae bacterium]
MYKPCLYANYRVITPLISRVQPPLAYRLLNSTGGIGKPLSHHTSYLFDYPAAEVGIEAVMKYLKLDRAGAIAVIRKFYLLETRLHLENLWLSKGQEANLEGIIDMQAMRKIAAMITRNGPMILLSGHTTYYFMILWALKALGHKTAFMMVNPRSAIRDNAIMQRSLILSADALSGIMPVLFTNEGGTVRKGIDLLKSGHTILMLLDIPGYRNRGIKIDLFDNEFWIPTGCLRIREEASVPAASIFSYAGRPEAPYRIYCSGIRELAEPPDLQHWANELESVIRQSPGSWFGWFILRDMI